jgi:ubiquitin-protein ligase
MDKVFEYNYFIDYDKNSIENIVLIWKIDRYASFLNNFRIIDNYLIFYGLDVEIKYEIATKLLQIDADISNLQLPFSIDEINEKNLGLKELLDLLENIIEELPDDVEEVSVETNPTKLNEPDDPDDPDDSDKTDDSDDPNDPNNLDDSGDPDDPDDPDKPTNSDDFENFKIELEEVEINVNDNSDNFEMILDDESDDFEINVKVESEAEVEIDKDEEVEQEYKLQAKEDNYDDLNLWDNDFSKFYNGINKKEKQIVLDEISIIKKSLEIFNNEKKIVDTNAKNYIFNSNAIIKMIFSEIIKINQKYNDIKIIPKNDNIFVLEVVLTNFKNPKMKEVMLKYKELHSDFDDSVKIEIYMPTQLYPYVPPSINIISPKFTDKFIYSIISLNYFKIENWNPSNTLEHSICALKTIIDNYYQIDLENKEKNYNYCVYKIWNLLKINNNELNINIDFIKLGNISNSKSYLASGTGYGHSKASNWDINKFLNDQKDKEKVIVTCLVLINNMLDDKVELQEIQIKILPILDFYFYDANILEITSKIDLYSLLVKIILKVEHYINDLEFNDRKFADIISKLQINVKEYIKLISNNEDKDIYDLCNNIINIKNEQQSSVINNIDNEYDILKDMQVGEIDFKQSITTSTSQSNKRILREFIGLRNSLPFTYDSSIYLRYDPNYLYKYHFIIIGPKDTPYENGCFLFDMILPTDYPLKCPTVKILTTGKGSVRFNPNLYACGKVCLSLLGTWSGAAGESWNEKSTILQVLVSIQSLILVEKPYYNEPGYEASYGTPDGEKRSRQYNIDVEYNCIKLAIIDMIKNPPLGFEEMIKTHFKIKQNDILKTVSKWKETNTKITDAVLTELSNCLKNL